ncbi:MAG TPA: phosphate acyltransferase [Hyphomicrobiaceae bacterium]|nr:phosphate acyltransferase [Hyphomicrobiaceae bacterium]
MLSFLDPRSPACPASLLDMARGSDKRPRLVVTNAGAPLPMAACKTATEAGLILPVMVGDTAAIAKEAKALNWDISTFEVIDAIGEEASARKAMIAIKDGRGDVLMKGQLHTDVFMKAALDRDTGIRDGRRFVHIFHITTPDSERPLVISDCAVNVAPDLKTRQVAVECVLDVFRALGTKQPKIAVLSATEEVIASVPSSLDADELVRWARESHPQALYSGPLALDLILSMDAVRIKGREQDPVAGDADAIIVPDLVSGNAIFKAMVYLRAGCAAGVVMGGKVPMVLTSRADPPEARLASIALAAVLKMKT